MSSLVKCSAWICRHKKPQKCAEIEVKDEVDGVEVILYIKLCGQCLTDALEEFE